MKAQLAVKPHSVLPGESVAEVTYNGQLVCTITGADGPGVRIISKHEISSLGSDEGFPRAMTVIFRLPQ